MLSTELHQISTVAKQLSGAAFWQIGNYSELCRHKCEMVVGANLFVCSFSKLWCIVVQFPITSRTNRITRLVAFQRAELGLEADI